MDNTSTVSAPRARRTREAQKLRAKAPLAAHFEDCAEAVKQLYAALTANSRTLSEQDSSRIDPLHATVERCKKRLMSWGHDTGASCRVLDHALRRASKPRGITITLLKELHELVVKSILLNCPDSTESLSETFTRSHDVDETPQPAVQNQPSVSPLQSPSKHEEAKEIIEIFGLVDEELGFPDDNVSLSPEEYLADVEGILDELAALRSTLLDPYDDELSSPLLETNLASKEDREYIQRAFKKASPALVDSLLAANRRRRELIYKLRREQQQEEAELAKSDQLQSKPHATLQSLAGHLSRGKERELVGKKSKRGPGSTRFRGYRKVKTPLGSEAGVSRTAPSTKVAESSLFSDDVIDEQVSVTSTTFSSLEPFTIPLHKPPGAPVPISSPKNLPFRCQYCTFEVPLEFEKQNTGMTESDWITHFYLDLQPYACTFDGCSRSQRLFGVKQQWCDHEIDYHRDPLRKSWYCPQAGCKTSEFESRERFEQHLRSAHQDFVTKQTPEFLNLVIDSSQQPSSISQSFVQQQCPLCGHPFNLKVKPLEWKDHIANHLEQFALLALGEEEDPESSDDEATRREIVTEFVGEIQERYNIAKSTHPEEQDTTVVQPSVVLTESFDHRGFTEASGDSGRTAENKNLWEDKVETYLTKQPEDELQDEGRDIDRSTEATIWHEVPKRDGQFVGRDHDLHGLNTFISPSGHICVISGRGGIGKTATAVEYAHRFQDCYSAIIWIEAETPGSLDDQYASVGAKIFSLGTEGGQDPMSYSINVRSKLGGWDKRWLLIFDNVEAWKDIVRYIPRNLTKGKGSVLITTRQQSLIEIESRGLQQVLHRIELDPLTSEEAGQFLLCSIDKTIRSALDVPQHPDYDLAVKIAELVENLPLALIMISGYVKISKTSLEDFLEIWEEKTAFRAKQVERSDGKSRRYLSEDDMNYSIDLLWDIGISELPNPARNLLEILAFLDPENIQKDLLVRDHDEYYLTFLNSTETAMYRRMIRHLQGRKLIEVREKEEDGVKFETYKIHRLLQEKIVMEIGAQLKFDSAMRKSTTLVRKAFPKAPIIQAPAPENWKACKEYMPHIFSLHRVFKTAQELFPGFQRTEELADLFYHAGFYIWDRQQKEEDGLAFLDAAETILDNIGISPLSPRRADIHCMSGLLRNAMGCQQREESFNRLEQALSIRKKVFQSQEYDRDRDILFQNAATDYAILLLNRYEFKKAEVIFNKCLVKYRTWGTEESIPFEYSKYYYNMGIVRICQERLKEAAELLKRSVELAEAAFGKTGQYWDNYFMLACCVRLSGDAQRALDMHLEIHKARLEELGKHSKSTILSTFAVGVRYVGVGDLDTAIAYMEECVDLANTSNWTEESIGRAQACLARMYRERGVNLDKASELQARADEVREKYLQYESEWVVGVGDQYAIFDDLQPTDEGRYLGSLLLQILWARNRGEELGHFIDSWGREVTVLTGL
ncbi:hypothetical protein QBC38DRAFT_547456 [Podospora fimiseda]|uniref:C2H2-type domain-containing protein n=1 Tax=Podospora fimiseda TaxID=252190 RepID=A0AAN7BJX7_9PEZI|nr:hypothetical protein QBC38DRAFT_547456 [Podospora fimiseda]